MSLNSSAGNEIRVVSNSIMQNTIQMISKAKINFDCFIASDFTTVIDPEILSLKLVKLKQKGLKLRMISDIGMKHTSFYFIEVL